MFENLRLVLLKLIVLPTFATALAAAAWGSTARADILCHAAEGSSETVKVALYHLGENTGGSDLWSDSASLTAAAIVKLSTKKTLLTGSYRTLPTRVGYRVGYSLTDESGLTASLSLVMNNFLTRPQPCHSRAGCDSSPFASSSIQTAHLTYGENSYALTCQEFAL